MLEIKNLSISIKSQQRIFEPVIDLNLSLNSGEVLAIIGESGSGKSMTALAIMRLLPNNAFYSANSKIELHQNDLINFSERQMCRVRGGQIAMIFQEPATSLNPIMTIGKQIGEVLHVHQNLYGRACYIEVLRLLDAVRIPSPADRYNSYPFELSGGMKQRVMLAIALAGKPQMLIADEPTTALDVTTQAQILDLLREIQAATQMGLMLITHDLSVAAQMADRVAVMHNGRIIEENTVKQIIHNPQQQYTKNLLASVPSLQPILSDVVINTSAPVLSVKDLRVYFPIKSGFFRRTVGHVRAVDGVNLELYAGETLALVGESGSGKTTVSKAILALLDQATGVIEYAGKNILTLNSQQMLKQRADLQIVFQDPSSALDPKQRIVDCLEEGMLAQGTYKDRSQRIAIIDELLLRVGLNEDFKQRFAHQLSGGERQRVCIARALTLKPKIIICDEATSSLDVSVQAQVLNLLQSLQKENNMAYLFITHDINLVKILANRVAVMHSGRIVETGLTREVLVNPQHHYTKSLLAAVPSIPHN